MRPKGEHQVTHINRPQFDIMGKKLEFDINPKYWMLKIMRHMRVLRILLPNWHHREKEISIKIRNEILENVYKINNDNDRTKRLTSLENIKGYRNVRYEKFEKYF